MKTLILRCFLVLILGLLLILTVLLPGIKSTPSASAYSPPASGNAAPEANYHLWLINEVFSCADGSIQFIELFTTLNGQQVLEDHDLQATNLGGTQALTFTFPTDSGSPTANKFLLLATANFGSLPGGVTPDFVISSTFVFTQGGFLEILPGGDGISYGAGALPVDGIHSLNGDGTTTGVNSPRNFNGDQGSITCPGAASATLEVTKKAPATVQSGKRITYTLTVTSSGTSSNTNVILTDTIPSGTTFASGSVQPVNKVLTWSLGNLAASATVKRTFAVTVTASTGVTIVNANYGVRSNQAVDRGPAVNVKVVSAQAFIYLPILIKDFPIDDHGADLIDLP